MDWKSKSRAAIVFIVLLAIPAQADAAWRKSCVIIFCHWHYVHKHVHKIIVKKIIKTKQVIIKPARKLPALGRQVPGKLPPLD